MAVKVQEKKSKKKYDHKGRLIKSNARGGGGMDLPEVTCDFSLVSRRWGVEWDTLFAQELKYQSASFLLPDGDDDDNVPEDFWLARIETADGLINIPERIASLMAQVVKQVPEYYTLPNVPEDVDWSNPDNIHDYIKEVRFNDFRTAVRNARIEASKN